MPTLKWTATKDQAGQRLDLALVAAELGLSRRKIRSIIDAGGAYVNDKRVRISSRQVATGDRVRLEYSDAALKQLKMPKASLAEPAVLAVEDEYVVLNKPPGLPAQATKTQAKYHVVAELQKLAIAWSDRAKFWLVHRLDQETSGIMIVARTPQASERLGDLFRERKIRKTYLAICRGIAEQDQWVERRRLLPINPRNGVARADPRGKTAETEFKVLARNKQFGLSLIECRPKTGRSHQIRVHLDLGGLPILGDKRYGKQFGDRLPEAIQEAQASHHMLHAVRLAWTCPFRQTKCQFEAPVPPHFAAILGAAFAAIEVPITN